MAKNTIIDIDATVNTDGFDISGGTTKRTLTISGSNITIFGTGTADMTFPTSSATVAGIDIVQTFSKPQFVSSSLSVVGAFNGDTVSLETTRSMGIVHIHKNTTLKLQPAVWIDGAGRTGPDTDEREGFGLYLSYNQPGNRQFVFGDTESGLGVRFIGPYIDGYDIIGDSRLTLQLGASLNGVSMAGPIWAKESMYLTGSLHMNDTNEAIGKIMGCVSITGQAHWVVREFSRGGTIVNASGVTTGNYIVWRAPYACTVIRVLGWRTGGTAATINARRNGVNNHLAAAVSVTPVDTWVDGGAIQNSDYAIGNYLEIMVVTNTGGTQIGIQVDFTRP